MGNERCRVNDDDCAGKYAATQLCTFHYSQKNRGIEPGSEPRHWRLHSEYTNKRCLVDNDDCTDRKGARGYCGYHYPRFLAGKDLNEKRPGLNENLTCAYAGCGRNVYSRKFCEYHYRRRGQPNLKQSPYYINCPVPGCEKTMGATQKLCKKHNQFRWRYELTSQQVVQMWKNPQCSISGCDATPSTARLVLDHDHSCCPAGKFPGSKVSCGKCNRGLICDKCNSALGMVGDSPEVLAGLISYLSDPPLK